MELERCLDELSEGGRPHSRGEFTVDPWQARRRGLQPLGLADVPLLMLAAAVEGGSGYFRVSGHSNLRLTWEGEAGPSVRAARSILSRERVDARFEPGALELPPAFHDFLIPLYRRSRHAPLDLVWGDRLVPGWRAEGIGVRSSGRPCLTVVDRGLDFCLPLNVAGLEIVARVPPLPGAPWPRCLLWGDELQRELMRIVEVVSSEGAR